MISYPFPPNASAGAVRSERFARYLPQFGWAVDVVTIRPREDMFEDRARLDMLGKDVCVHFTRTLDPWLWLRDKRPKTLIVRGARSAMMRLFSFPDHMLLWVPFAVKKGLEICKTTQIDAIYSTSPPHSSHLAARILSSLTHKPWLADFRDPWTLNAYRGRGLIENLLVKIDRSLETGVLNKASVVLANTPANRKNLLKVFSFLSESKVIHVPNGWEEFPSEVYRAEKKDGPLTIVHAGTFYTRFKPYSLFHILAKWRRENNQGQIPPWPKDIRIVLLGSGDPETVQVVQDLQLKDIVEIRPWVSMEEVRRIMCQADLLWASLGTGKESSTYIPSKLFEYIAAKRPILGFFPEGEAEKLIKGTGVGLVFSNDDFIAVIKSIHEAICVKGIKEPSWFNPGADIAKYHIENITRNLAQILEESVKSNRFS
ncbi:MAG: glycosyltransferase family 4 protein, partial [Candidatus Aenigmarchaeota archaeon]|nr:glycosyltransferase family 4 protein [Candidatus Aenigmarchaeota archaeon]